MIHTHVLNRGGLGVHSTLDRLPKPMAVETGGLRLQGGSVSNGGTRLSNGVEVDRK